MKSLLLLIGEMVAIWVLILLIKLWTDRSNILHRDTSPSPNFSIRFDAITSPLARRDLGYAEVKVEDTGYGGTIWYTSHEAREKSKEESGSRIVPLVVYNVQDERGFSCLLNK